MPEGQKNWRGTGLVPSHERKVTMSDDYDYTEGDDYSAATSHYAGLTCGCGDYSCPRMHNDAAQCVNAE